MAKIKKVLLVGIGGYGGTYANAVLTKPNPDSYKVVGIVDPFAERAARYAELKALDIPFFDTMEEFYAKYEADLAVLATPIPLHCPQSCFAMENGSNVLCEKPVAAVPDEAKKMIQVSKRTGRFIAIGYQWSFSAAVQAFKADVLAGKFGAPVSLKSLVLWPRNDAYYGRNNWAGAKKNANGEWILDSPVNNAAAHYLHNMLYVIGDKVDTAAVPDTLTAELYRANSISNFDTASISIKTKTGVDILFLTSHAISRSRGPEFVYSFEKGTATFDIRDGQIRASFMDGTKKAYGNPNLDSAVKFWECLDAVDSGKLIVCGAEASIMQSHCVWAANISVPDIKEFPLQNVYKMGAPGHQFKIMEGLAELMEKAYENGTMLHEQGNASWMQVGKTVKVPM